MYRIVYSEKCRGNIYWRLVLRRLLIGFVALAVLIVLLCVAALCFGANAVLQF